LARATALLRRWLRPLWKRRIDHQRLRPEKIKISLNENGKWKTHGKGKELDISGNNNMAFHGRVAFSIGIASTGKEEKKQGKMHYDMMIPYLGQIWDSQRFWDEIEAGKRAQLHAYMGSGWIS
jgi:hypothetical protein